MKGKSHINYIVCVHVGGGGGSSWAAACFAMFRKLIEQMTEAK